MSILYSTGAYRAHPDRLALDYSTGNIYYTAVSTSQLPTSFTGIGVVSPNGQHRKLISGGVQPRAVEIDPSKGWVNIYKHVSNTSHKISRNAILRSFF